MVIPNPEIHRLRKTTQSFRGPTDVGITIGSHSRILGAKAIVLLLSVGNNFGFGLGFKTSGGDKAESFGEGRGLHVSRGEAERAVVRDERVGSAIRSEVKRD